SLFLYMGIAKTRNPCGFSQTEEKIPCYFPCYATKVERIVATNSASAPGVPNGILLSKSFHPVRPAKTQEGIDVSRHCAQHHKEAKAGYPCHHAPGAAQRQSGAGTVRAANLTRAGSGCG